MAGAACGIAIAHARDGEAWPHLFTWASARNSAVRPPPAPPPALLRIRRAVSATLSVGQLSLYIVYTPRSGSYLTFARCGPARPIGGGLGPAPEAVRLGLVHRPSRPPRAR
eukprot:1767563-Prymnesium_polylepis.1